MKIYKEVNLIARVLPGERLEEISFYVVKFLFDDEVSQYNLRGLFGRFGQSNKLKNKLQTLTYYFPVRASLYPLYIVL